MVCGEEASSEIIATSANQIVPLKFWQRYKNIHQTPLSSWSIEGRSRYETMTTIETLAEVFKACWKKVTLLLLLL